MASPPKPWERASAGAGPRVSAATTPTMASPAPSAASSSSTAPPPIPQRPSTLGAAANSQNPAAYGTAMPGAAAVGPPPYGAYGAAYQNPYATPYPRFGGYGAGAYGGGGMYPGAYGGGYGAMYATGAMYGGAAGMGGPAGSPNDPNSLTSRFSQGTATTFQMLEGVVGAFGGFAQMLESTYMATHSSFFAMVSVAEQFATLRDTLGSILGIFTLVRWLRTAVAKLLGRPLPADSRALTSASFARFEGRAPPAGAAADRPRASRKPLLFFLLAAFGLPYLMSKMIKFVASQEEEEARRRVEAQGATSLTQQAVDPARLEFCRVVHDYVPDGSAQAGIDLSVRKGDLVAVLSKEDPFGNPIDWWKCRTRDGRMGYLPSTFLEVVKRNGPAAQKPVAAIKAAASDSSRANSITTSTSGIESISGSVQDKDFVRMEKSGGVGGSGSGGGSVLENFQKSQFYS